MRFNEPYKTVKFECAKCGKLDDIDFLNEVEYEQGRDLIDEMLCADCFEKEWSGENSNE